MPFFASKAYMPTIQGEFERLMQIERSKIKRGLTNEEERALMDQARARVIREMNARLTKDVSGSWDGHK